MRSMANFHWIWSRHGERSLQILPTIVSWIHSYFENVVTKFIVNNRTDPWKTVVNFLNHNFSCTFCYAFPSFDKTAGLGGNNKSIKKVMLKWKSLLNKVLWNGCHSIFFLTKGIIFKFFFCLDKGPERKLVCSICNILHYRSKHSSLFSAGHSEREIQN